MIGQTSGGVVPGLGAGAAVFCKRWTPMVVALLLERSHRFGELLHRLDQVSDRMLSERLKELEVRGLVHREVLRGPPMGVRYELTPAGAALRPVVEALAAWGNDLPPALPGASPGAAGNSNP